MVVLVEAVPLERDADPSEDLVHGPVAGLVDAVGQRIVGKGLPDLELGGALFTAVFVCGHGSVAGWIWVGGDWGDGWALGGDGS